MTTKPDSEPIVSQPTLLGQVIDQYEIVGVLGQGGMGCVYEAINTKIKKRVAIKSIDGALTKNAEAIARFQREALAAGAIESPHIVQIFDASETEDGVPYIVMEMLRGTDLGDYIDKLGRLEVDEALNITVQILKGLHHAHKAGIVHRDLKPDNVFLVDREDEPAHVKLLDFGVSKISRTEEVPLQTLTRQGTVVGTPFYMSPEQAQAFPDVDGRTDIYSVGAILYECLSGRPPHAGKSYEQVIVNICMKDAEDVRLHNPSVPEAVAHVLMQALQREREDRFKTSKEMLAALVDGVPDMLKVSSPSKLLRNVSSHPRGGDESNRASSQSGERVATAKHKIIPSTPPSGRPANGLADTVNAGDTPFPDSERDPNGAAAKSSDDRAVLTMPSPEVSTVPMERRRWLLAVAPGVALMLAVALYLGGSNGSETAPPGGGDAALGEAKRAESNAMAEAPATAEETNNDAAQSAAATTAVAGQPSAPTAAGQVPGRQDTVKSGPPPAVGARVPATAVVKVDTPPPRDTEGVAPPPTATPPASSPPPPPPKKKTGLELIRQ